MGKSSSKLAVAGDGSWLDASERPSKVEAELKDAYRQCIYKARVNAILCSAKSTSPSARICTQLTWHLQSQYVPMQDGVRLAVDILLPSKCGGGAAVPAVFIQCRYMRSAALRWPFSLMTGGLPVDFITQELKTTLVAAGYAVVSVDVRGTGGYVKQGAVCNNANHNIDVMYDHIHRSVLWPVASAVEPRGATGLSGGVGLDYPATLVLEPGNPALPGLDPSDHVSCNLPQNPLLCKEQT